MKEFLKTLETQRWDDHRYYHQSRINQTLHLISAISFLVAYAWVFIDPAISGLIGWGISMVTRQSGHYLFEPKGFDEANQVTYQHKEDIKVGYNMARKTVLIGLWLSTPLLLWVQPSLFGLIEPATSRAGFIHDLGLLWFALGVAGLCFRVCHLTLMRGDLTGFVWATKILTDPIYDIKQYWRSPFYLMRGELLDPMHDVRSTR